MSSSPTKPFGAGRGDGESVRSPYAPKRNRATADSVHNGDDDPPPPRFLVSSRDEEREPDLTNFTDSSLQFRESPTPQSTRRSPLNERRSTYSTAEQGRGDSTDDIDLQRLEESVRRLSVRPPSVGCARRPKSSPRVMSPQTPEFSADVPIPTSTAIGCRLHCSLRFSPRRPISGKATADCGPS